MDAERAETASRIGRVVTFGEAMIRLTPPGHERLERTRSLDLTIGGAELNTAVALRCLDIPSAFVTALPENGLGRLIEHQARAYGVDTSDIRWVDEHEGRTGLYFLEEGADPRPSAVTYDRQQTAISRIAPGAFDWPSLLTGASCLHLSGITLALSESCRAESMTAIRAANALGVPVAFDLNYRSKLWSEADARGTFTQIVPMVDILFASRGGLGTFFALEGTHEEVMRQAIERLGVVVVTMTRKKAKGSQRLKLQSMAMGQNGVLVENAWRSVEVVDRLGGGDAYAAGFLAGFLENPANLSRAVALGAAASALKHTMPGDFLCATRAEIEAATDASTTALLQR